MAALEVKRDPELHGRAGTARSSAGLESDPTARRDASSQFCSFRILCTALLKPPLSRFRPVGGREGGAGRGGGAERRGENHVHATCRHVR